MTSGFARAAEAHRKLLKHPDLPYAVVPHPIVSMSDAEITSSADAILEEIDRVIARAAHGERDG